MAGSSKCERCGSILPADVELGGQCPVCLLRGDLAGTAEKIDSGAPPDLPDLESLRKSFPQLEILEVLGRGGMGIVYKARQTRLDRLVALKILSPRVANQVAFAERFAREARALARLQHPNIVLVYDFGDVDGRFYLIMEFVEGASLRHIIKGQKLSASEALAVVPQICEGLQYAHDQGVVHRDIKPENLLLDTTGRLKIADFGLAKLLDPGSEDYTLTGASQVMGTPHYMAPEQMKNPLGVDHRVDIYSLGVVFYELLTNELPMGQFPMPSNKAKVDVGLDQVVLKALAKEPEERYQHASEVRSDVERFSEISDRRSGRQRDALAFDHSASQDTFAGWIARIPGGPPVAAGAALLLGWALFVILRMQNLGDAEEWLSVPYPFFFFPIVFLRQKTTDSTFLASQFLRLFAFVSCVSAVVVLCRGGGTPKAMAFESLAGIVYVGNHLFFDRWVRSGSWDAIGKSIVLLVVATVMHSSVGSYNQGGQAYYFASGMTAVMGATSGLIVCIDLKSDQKDPAPVIRAGAVGLLGAVFFFQQYIF